MFNAAFTQSTVTVFINGVKKGEYIKKTGETDSVITLKKNDCKKIQQLSVQIKGEHIGNIIYKRALEVTDSADQFLLKTSETAGTPGQFIFINTTLKSILVKGRSLKLYLLMEPANDMMMIPTKRIYMCKVAAK